MSDTMEDLGDGVALGEHYLPSGCSRPPLQWRRPVYLDGRCIGWAVRLAQGWTPDDDHQFFPDEETCARHMAAKRREAHIEVEDLEEVRDDA